ncbi:MAG: phosphate acyltransferase PlsX [Armatimonadetes bacterium]|jgi:glycerol-3-phosphate acyltransferase PlsX|nr:phosphate acyltransferase PlsX [Armatimonadota bacterium]
MIIAVDAMGGDYAPSEIVKGAALGSKNHGVDVILVGDEARIKSCLPPDLSRSSRVEIKHASEIIGMDEHASAIRTRKDASVVVTASLVKENKADAMVCAGNTAAAMAVAALRLGRIAGIDRPAIASVMPSPGGGTVMLDAGAVVNCSSENLRQFAVMGSIYADKVLSIANPRVGLLSVGEEKSKGNDVIKAAHEAISSTSLNFIGNVEGCDLFSGRTDVVVCDGFAGNVALKTAEGLAGYIERLIKEELHAHPLAYIPLAMLKPFLGRIKKNLDYSEYGGAPLLGLNGMCIICHGRSKARAISNAVRAAKEAASRGVVSAIRDSLAAPNEAVAGKEA